MKSLNEFLDGKYFLMATECTSLKVLDHEEFSEELAIGDLSFSDFENVLVFDNLDEIIEFALEEMVNSYNLNQVADFMTYYEFINKHRPELIDNESKSIMNEIKTQQKIGTIAMYQGEIEELQNKINKLMNNDSIQLEVKKIEL